MLIIEDIPLSSETPAIPAHGTNARASVTHHMGAAVLEGINLTRHYVTRIIEDVIKPAIKTFLETCDTNPRIAAVVATPALLGFLLALAFFIISTLVLIVWTIFKIALGIIFVIIGGIVSLFFKLLLVVLATIPLVGIATALLVGANRVSQSIINRMPQNGIRPVTTQTAREIDWKAIVEHLVNLGKNLGPRSAAVWEGLLVLRVALRNSIAVLKNGIKDLRNARVESLHNDSPSHFTAMSGEPSQGNTNNVRQAHSAFEYTDSELCDLQPTGSTEGLKRRAPFPQTGEDVVDDVPHASERM